MQNGPAPGSWVLFLGQAAVGTDAYNLASSSSCLDLGLQLEQMQIDASCSPVLPVPHKQQQGRRHSTACPIRKRRGALRPVGDMGQVLLAAQPPDVGLTSSPFPERQQQQFEASGLQGGAEVGPAQAPDAAAAEEEGSSPRQEILHAAENTY